MELEQQSGQDDVLRMSVQSSVLACILPLLLFFFTSCKHAATTNKREYSKNYVDKLCGGSKC